MFSPTGQKRTERRKLRKNSDSKENKPTFKESTSPIKKRAKPTLNF